MGKIAILKAKVETSSRWQANSMDVRGGNVFDLTDILVLLHSPTSNIDVQ